MTLIDNKEKTMLESLQNALKGAKAVDIHVGYFYFSGFKALAKELKNKHIRIVVGSFIDPSCVPEILNHQKKEENFDLSLYGQRGFIESRSLRKELYSKGLIELVNQSSLFDSTGDQEALKLFIKKIEDGSLEIKLSKQTEHGKMYIIHNTEEFSQGGDSPGTVFIGSSNFTYNGLIGQGELNDGDRNKQKYEEYCQKFEQLWNDSDNIDIATPISETTFIEKIKKELWPFQVPAPYDVYIRILDELFSITDEEKVKTPSQITGGDYLDLKYQIDAIKEGIDKLEKYDGVIIADVVGLGKSIIASAIANNRNMRTVIITPPHLFDQWNDYQSQFKLPGTKIYTTGKIQNAYDDFASAHEPILLIIDEAHRFRNELTTDYKLLHDICRSHPDNKVLALTATPFNNDPKDVFALIKLFQTPGLSTIKSVDNLSLRFRELIDRYKKLRTYMRKNPKEEQYIIKESSEIALELKRLIEPVIIRRSRLDIKNRTIYREDIEKQGIEFSEVVGPEILDYDLGQLSDLYTKTLRTIIGESKENGFVGARYKPALYVKEDRKDDFRKTLEAAGMDETDLSTAQANNSKFMKRLLVTRFESSKEAFKITLNKMIQSNILIEDWWNNLGKIPIQKKGQIPDAESFIANTDDDFTNQFDEEFFEDELKKYNTKGLVAIDKDLISDEFITKVGADKTLLCQIRDEWFGDNSPTKDLDPKTDGVVKHIKEKLNENKDRKIIIFSAYADTVNYLYEEMKKRGEQRIFKYTAADSSAQNKKIIEENFNAGYKREWKNDYDVLIATDALSEGYNLHRAGIIINYDIPYNPTRVIQRIGRINRVNKKVFDQIFIYNFFPTEIGESEIRIKQIATLKIDLINSVLGSDTRTLTSDEELEPFLKGEFDKEEKKQEAESWFTPHQEIYDKVKDDAELMARVRNLKCRSRVLRLDKIENIAIAFGKKGSHAIFAIKQENEEAKIVPSEIAVPYFAAKVDEKGQPADEKFDEIFEIVRDQLFAKSAKPPMGGRRGDSLMVLKLIAERFPQSNDYCKDLTDIIKKYDDINDGALKDIASLKLKDVEEDFEKLKKIVPQHQIDTIHERVQRLEEEPETIVLSEELRK